MGPCPSIGTGRGPAEDLVQQVEAAGYAEDRHTGLDCRLHELSGQTVRVVSDDNQRGYLPRRRAATGRYPERARSAAFEDVRARPRRAGIGRYNPDDGSRPPPSGLFSKDGPNEVPVPARELCGFYRSPSLDLQAAGRDEAVSRADP